MSFLQVGFIDNQGHPRIRIRVQGTNPEEAAELDALIDTGFTGFLLLPLMQAFPLGLTLIGTTENILADGRQITSFTAKGTVTIIAPSQPSIQPAPPFHAEYGDETADGTIILNGDGDEILVGMEFLSTLKKFLMIGKNVVALMTEWDETQWSGKRKA